MFALPFSVVAGIQRVGNSPDHPLRSGVEGRTTPEGIPIDREPLRHRTLLLADLLPKLPENEPALILIKLGLTGQICGVGWLGNSDDLYRDFAPQAKRLTLEEHYLLRLARCREELFLQVVHEVLQQPANFLTQRLHDPSRLHNANRLILCFGEKLGLPSQSIASLDRTARPTFVDRWIFGVLSEVR